MQAGRPSVIRIRFADSTGQWHWVEAHAQVFVDADGRPDGYQSSLRVVDKEVEAEGLLRRRATYDDLTGAMKRDPALRQLHEVGQHLRSPGDETAVLFIDVDDFKSVNDTHGHAVGDALLRRLVDVISDCVRAGDTVARMGGDEFLVILTGLHNVDEATAVAEKIRAGCNQPVTLHDTPLAVSVSIGVTLSDPVETGDDLVARADKAMYEAKAAGRNQVTTINGARHGSVDGSVPVAEPAS